MPRTRENPMEVLYREAEGKPFSEVLKMYLKQARGLGLGESGIVMRTVYYDLLDKLYQDGDTTLNSSDEVARYLEDCRRKKLIK